MLLFLAYFSLDQLHELNHGDDEEAEADGDGVFAKVYADKSEGVCQEGTLANEGGCHQGADACDPQGFILRFEGEDAAALRTHIKAVENFRHRHGQKRHSRTVRTVFKRPYALVDIMPDKIGNENENGNDKPLIYDVKAHTA